MSTAGRCMAASTASGITVGPGIARNSRPARKVMGGSVKRQGGFASTFGGPDRSRNIQGPIHNGDRSPAADFAFDRPENILIETPDCARSRAHAGGDRLVPERSLDPDACLP